MTPIHWLIVSLIILTIFLYILWRRTVRILKEVKFAKASLSTKYGKMTEQFMPFLDNYPHDPGRFRFIGSPIDGIQFEDDRIIFIEFKTHSARVTATQERIRHLVNSRQVAWEEYRI